MARCKIRIEFDRENRSYQAGETLEGRVFIMPNKDFSCDELTIQYLWRTHGAGDVRSDTIDNKSWKKPEFKEDRERSFPFKFTVPRKPLTYHGHRFCLDHYIKVRLDVPWAVDSRDEEDIVVTTGPFRGSRHKAPSKSHTFIAKPKKTKIITTKDKAGAMGCGLAVIAVCVFFPPLAFFGLLAGSVVAIGGLFKWLKERHFVEIKAELEDTVVKHGGMLSGEITITSSRNFNANGVFCEIRGREFTITSSNTSSTSRSRTFSKEKHQINGPLTLRKGQTITLPFSLPIQEHDAWTIRLGSVNVIWDCRFQVDVPFSLDWKGDMELKMLHPQASLPPIREKKKDDDDAEGEETDPELPEGMQLPDVKVADSWLDD